MTYPPPASLEFSPAESAIAGLRRITAEQIALAAWHIGSLPSAHPARLDLHVHEARKASKRARAIVRLGYRDLGEDTYRHVNTTVRDVARSLSPARTAAVRLQVLEGLDSSGVASELRTALSAEAANVMAALLDGSEIIGRSADRLQSTAVMLETAAVDADFTPAADGLRRTYRRGRRAMTRAYDTGVAHEFHVWRKRVKYLRHQIEALAPTDHERLQPLAVTVADIGEGLGRHHDLTDLEEAVHTLTPWQPSETERAALLAQIDRERREIEVRIEPAAHAVYARKPDEFVIDIARFWDAWRARTP